MMKSFFSSVRKGGPTPTGEEEAYPQTRMSTPAEASNTTFAAAMPNPIFGDRNNGSAMKDVETGASDKVKSKVEKEKKNFMPKCCRKPTRKQKMLIYFTFASFATLVSFYIARFFQALSIADTQPSIVFFAVTDLCTDTLSFSISGSMNNPALIGATIEATSNIINTQHGCIGTLITPEIPIPAGESEFVLKGQFEITSSCADNLAQSFQSYLDGTNLDISVSLSGNVGFSADVFLFPISLPVNVPLKSFLQSAFNTTELTREEQRAEAELCAKFNNCSSSLEVLQLLSADNTTVTGRVGLNLSSSDSDSEEDDVAEDEVSYFSEDFEFTFDVPGIDFEVSVFESPAAAGSSEPFVFGAELLFALANLTWSNVPAINDFVNKTLNFEDVLFSVTASQYDITEESNEYCFFNDLIEGLTIQSNLTTFDVESNSTDFISVDGIKLNSFDNDGVFGFETALDILGVQEFFNFEGLIPPICVDISTNVSSNTARESLGSLCTNSEVQIIQDPSNSTINEVFITADLDNITLILDVMDFILEEDGLLTDAFLFVKPIGDSLVDALMRTLIVGIPLDFSSDESSSARRMLSSDLSSRLSRFLQEDESRLSVSVSSGVDSIAVDVEFREFSAVDLDGLKIALGNFDLALSVQDGGGGEASLSFQTNGFDTFSTETPQNLTAQLLLSDNINGDLLLDLIEGFIFEYRAFEVLIEAEYNISDQFSLVSVTQELRRTNWTDFRPEDVDFNALGASDNTGSSGTVSSDVFQIQHAEFEGVNDNNIEISTSLTVDIGFEVRISVSPIAVGIAECSSGDIIAVISTSEIIVQSSTVAETIEEVGINIEPGELDVMLSAFETFDSGSTLSICLVESQTPNNNFLSQILVSFGFSFDFEKGDSETSSAVSSSGTLEIEVKSLERAACVNLTIEVDRNPESTDSISFGWGTTELVIADAANKDFFSFSISEGFIGGTCNSFFATPTSCNSSIVAEICLVADDSLDAFSGAEVVRNAIEDVFIEQIASAFTMSGNTASRRGSDPAKSFLSTLNLPANAFDRISRIGEDSNSDSSSLIEAIELKSIVQEKFMLDLEPGSSLPTISLSVPPVDLVFSALGGASTARTELVFVADLPSVNITIDSYEALLNVTFGQINASEYAVEGLSTSTSFLSRCIPRFKFSSNTTVTEKPSASMILDIDGDNDEVVFSFLFAALDEALPFPFKMSALDLTITNQINDLISISTTSSVFGPKGSTFELTATGAGADLPLTAQAMFDGVDVPVGFDGTFTSTGLPISASFVIKKEILSPVAVGTEDNKDDINNEFIPIELVLLGGSNVGEDIRLPCLVDGICSDLLKDETTESFTGVTVGLGVQLPLVPEGSLRYEINFLTDFFLDVAANGFDLGFGRLGSGFTLRSNETGPGFVSTAVLTATLFSGQEENARATIQTLLEGFDIVFSFSGRSTENYASNLVSAITQDIEILSESEQGDSEEVGQLNLEYQLVRTLRKQLEALLDLKLNYTDDNFKVSAGSVEVQVLYGHDGSGDLGVQVARAKLPDQFELEGKPEEQNIPVTAFLEWNDENGDYLVMNSLLSDGIFSKTLPLELTADVEPIPSTASKYSELCKSGCPFSVQTYLTIPEQLSSISFIDSFQVVVSASSIFSDIQNGFDLTVPSVLAIKNTFGIDLLPSFYSVEVLAYDTDGIGADSTTQCLSSFNPCAVGYCEDPLSGPQNVQQSNANQAIEGGSRNEPLCKPPASAGGSKECGQPGFILDGEVGEVLLNINPTLADGVRLVDDMFVMNSLCADIINGQLVAGLQADIPGCEDNANPGRTANELQCTFIIDVTFDLKKFGLTEDSCKGIQEDASNQITISDGNFGFQTSPILNWGETLANNPYKFTNLEYDCFTCSYRQAERYFQNNKVSIADSFRITFTETITKEGVLESDGYSIIFTDSVSKPANVKQKNSGEYDGNCQFGWRCLTGTTSIGIVFKTVNCNGISIERDGTINDDDSLLLRRTQGMGAGMTFSEDQDNYGRSRNYEIIYDAFSKRIKVSVSESLEVSREAEFDLDMLGHFQGETFAFLGIGATNSGTGKNIFEIKDFRISTSRTGSKETTLVNGAIELPAATTLGRINIQARDPAGRPRGTGGDTFDVTILKTDGTGAEASSAGIASVDLAMNSCTNCPSPSDINCQHVSDQKQRVCDNGDGTYTVFYIINERGRYMFKAKCVSSECIDSNVDSILTERVFVRLPPES